MDIFEEFLFRESLSSTKISTRVINSERIIGQPEDGQANGERPEDWSGLPGRRGFAPKTVVNYVRVLGPYVQTGQHGRYSNRKYRVQCIAPTGPGKSECGKKGLVTYHQLYYGTIFSCGCLPRPKHPPIRMEGQRVGCLDVLRWCGEYGGSWECVCVECGALLYRKTVADVRLSSRSCDNHHVSEVKQ
jgi:hypothetical protein